MDKEQAKFILRSFRPGEDDLKTEDFADALAMAASNRELGEWLAEERAMDEAFTQAISSIELPENLRKDIIGCLDGERHDYPNAENRQDAAMIGALASVPVPSELRGDILAAMERSTPRDRAGDVAKSAIIEDPLEANKPLFSFRKLLAIPLAAAAGIALALLLNTEPQNDKPYTSLVKAQPVPIEAVPISFIQTYESPDFGLELKENDHGRLVESLKSRSLPCPCCLPPGLENTKSIGCRELIIDGKHGSLICFQQDDIGVVHLVIFKREDVEGSCANKLARPCYIDKGKWSVARWQNDESVFFLIAKGEVDQMKKMF